MSNEDKVLPEDLPAKISREAAREKSKRHGSITTMHTWWARRPTVVARIATYLALTENLSNDQELITSLGNIEPSSQSIRQAFAHIRDTQWRWLWQESIRTS